MGGSGSFLPQALGTYKHSWKISRVPSEPRDPPALFRGERDSAAPRKGRGWLSGCHAGAGAADSGTWARQGLEREKGQGDVRATPILRQQDLALPTHLYTPLPGVQPGTGQCGWVGCRGRQGLCLHRWSARGRQMQQTANAFLPAPSEHPGSGSFRTVFPGQESRLVPHPVTQRGQCVDGSAHLEDAGSDQIAQG